MRSSIVPIENLEAILMERQGKWHGQELAFLCPCHDDHHPSAHFNPQKLVWYCFSCGAGGGLKDLACQLGLIDAKGPIKFTPQRPRFDWRHFAFAIQYISDGLFLRSERILKAAHGLNPSTWTDTDLAEAMTVIAKAYFYREQSERLADLAVTYRAKHWDEERKNALRRRNAA